MYKTVGGTLKNERRKFAMSLKDVLKVPMRLQFFAEGEDESNPNTPQQQATTQVPEFDIYLV